MNDLKEHRYVDGAAFLSVVWLSVQSGGLFLAVLATRAAWMDMIILTRTNKPDQMQF